MRVSGLLRPLFIPSAIVLVGLLVNGMMSIKPAQSQAVFGGPESLTDSIYVIEDTSIAFVAGDQPDILSEEGGQEGVAGFFIVDQATVLDAANPFGLEAGITRDGLMTYVVEAGDTLSAIAEQFGINVDTLLGSNKGLTSTIRAGQEVVILPVKGVLHTVVSGDTLDALGRKYGVDSFKIAEFNKLGATLAVGEKLVIPGAKPVVTATARTTTARNLPRYTGYYAIPTVGHNWGKLHGNNGVDIANKCGTEVRAAAAGVVTTSKTSGYNGGYGGLVVIKHDNGTQTYYAHLIDASVGVGDSVVRSQLIGHMGNTGKTTGITGCHLHFEVRGAVNPYAL